MSIQEMILKQKGIWLFKYRDNYKIIVDLDKGLYDEYKWYKVMGTLEQEIDEETNKWLFKNVAECKKIS